MLEENNFRVFKGRKKITTIERNKSEMKGLMELSFLTTERRTVGRKTKPFPPPQKKANKQKGTGNNKVFQAIS